MRFLALAAVLTMTLFSGCLWDPGTFGDHVGPATCEDGTVRVRLVEVPTEAYREFNTGYGQTSVILEWTSLLQNRSIALTGISNQFEIRGGQGVYVFSQSIHEEDGWLHANETQQYLYEAQGGEQTGKTWKSFTAAYKVDGSRHRMACDLTEDDAPAAFRPT